MTALVSRSTCPLLCTCGLSTHTHTHTHTNYIYVFICGSPPFFTCVCVCVCACVCARVCLCILLTQKIMHNTNQLINQELINSGDGPTCEGIARGAAAEARAGTTGCNAGCRPRELGGGCRRRRAAGRLLLLRIYYVMLSYICTYIYICINTYIHSYMCKYIYMTRARSPV